MATSNNPYKDLNIDRKSMKEVVCALGAEDYFYEKVGGTFQMGFRIDGMAHKLAVYENKGGSTTLSRLAMEPALFIRVADAIRDGCGLGNGGRFDVAIPRFAAGNLQILLDYLAEDGVQVTNDVTQNGYRMFKLRSPQGDTLTVKDYDNGTFHMQGRRAMLASMALDCLANVLNHDQAVNVQLDTFNVKVNLVEIGNEVEGRLPTSFKRVSSVVLTQLTTAVALSKLDIELPDYSPVAFPALKALEGFLKTELTFAGFTPSPNATFGEYFEEKSGGFGHQMRPIQAQHAGEPLATLLAESYTVFSNQRHALAHVGTGVHNTRILPDLTSARTVVGSIFDTIERFCSRLGR
jgi:hypothetical protein